MKHRTGIHLVYVCLITMPFFCLCGKESPTTAPNGKPEFPTGLQVKERNGMLTVLWDPVPSAEQYNLYWAIGPNVDKNCSKESNIDCPFDFANLKNGTRYYVRLSAENEYGESQLSMEVDGIPAKIEHPEELNYTADLTEMALSWTPVKNAEYYTIYIDSMGTKRVIENVLNTSYTFNNCTPSSSLIVSVSATNLDGESALSSSMTMYTANLLPPEGIKTSISSKNVTLSWKKDSQVDSYYVYFSPTPPVTAKNDKIAVKGAVYVHKNLEPSTTYYYRVSSLFRGVESELSGEIDVLTLGPGCELLWQYTTGKYAGPPALDENGNVYIVGGNELQAINALGKRKWSYGGYEDYSPVIIDQTGTLYVVHDRGVLHAVNADGSIEREYKAITVFFPFLMAAGNNGIIYVNTGSCIYALSGNDAILWKYPFPDKWHSRMSPIITNDGTLYTGCYNIYDQVTLYAIDTEAALQWEFDSLRGCHSAALDNNGNLIVGSRPLYAFSGSGEKVWQYNEGGEAAVGKDGTVYLGNDNSLIALSEDGNTKWKFVTNGSVLYNPTIDDNGIIYFGSLDSSFYAVNPDGILKWKYKTDGIVQTRPLISDSGVIYFTNENGYLYAVQTDSKGPATSSWPMWQQNAQRTGHQGK